MARILYAFIASCLLLAVPRAVPETPQPVHTLTPDEVYTMAPDEIKTARDGLFDKGFNVLSPEERFNAVMLDYYMNWSDKAVRPKLSYGWEAPGVG